MWEGLGAHVQRSDVITSYNLRDSDVLVLFEEALWEKMFSKKPLARSNDIA